MLTIRAEIKKGELKTDGTFNVKLRFTQNRKMKRLATSFFLRKEDLTKTGEIKKSCSVKQEIDDLVREYRNRVSKLQVDMNQYSLDQIFTLLKFNEEKSRPIDYIAFCKDWISKSKIKSKGAYYSAVNSFTKFLKKDSLDITTITSKMVDDYKLFLNKEREDRVKKLKEEGKRIPSFRCNSLYLVILRRLFNEACKQYNNPELGTVRISNAPFAFVEIPAQEATRKRALSPEIIRKIFNLPYRDSHRGSGKVCRYNLAKDMFIMSFCLIGMNSVDLFNTDKMIDNTIIYKRAKTTDRRADEALMKVDVPQMLQPFIDKYRDKRNKRLFNFYRLYPNRQDFNKAINIGLKQIGAELNIEDLEFYAARHSWATIALNKCKINKYTVHAALNHVDPSMRVTDIYIERDFVNENEANKKVLEFVFGK